MRRGTTLVAAAALCLVARPAQAQLCTASATGIVFGVVDPSAGAASDIAGSVSVTCSAATPTGVAYTLQLGAGNSGSAAARSLVGVSGGRLAYQVYADPARTVIWGDGTVGTTVNDAFGVAALSSITRTYTAYGRIPGGQRVRPDLYSDTLVVLVIY